MPPEDQATPGPEPTTDAPQAPT
ncbi:MAG: hypothetical protein QOI86_1478, partial [Actinomycetota bacterium]|nr:hypothetical protein [Actinomycetota bacterium]